MSRTKARQRVRVWHVANGFGTSGIERAMAHWARHLDRKTFEPRAFSIGQDGPRRQELVQAGIPATVLGPDRERWRAAFKDGAPEIIHTHRHGAVEAVWTDFCGLARAQGTRVIVETNVFGERRPSEGPASPDVMGYPSAFCLWRYAGWPASLPQDHLKHHTVLYYPMDLERFPPQGFSPAQRAAARKAFHLPQDAIVAGRLGWPDPDTWPHWLMLALARALWDEPRLHLVLMGAPPSAVEKAEALGMADRCRFVASSSVQADVWRFYSAIDMLAHASQSGESFGYPLADAMAWGIPVLVHSTPWAENAQIELVGHEAQGLVAGRPLAFTEALLRLAQDARLRERLGGNGRDSVARFEAGALTRSLEGVYARALQEQGVENAALEGLWARPTAPDESWVRTFGAAYARRLAQREAPSAWGDRLWALYCRLRFAPQRGGAPVLRSRP